LTPQGLKRTEDVETEQFRLVRLTDFLFAMTSTS
jgi:hypothetical protein